ncbi:MAG TPA: hypothetical protein VF110_06605 [Burkholderiales bacterium]
MLDFLALLLSLAALAIALLALLRGRAFGFAPEVLAGDVILPRASTAGGLKFLLPLQFTNAGYAGGIIQWVALRLTVDGDTAKSILLSPVAEVDMQSFIRAKRRLEPQNVEPFAGFALEGKRALAKFVLFEPAEQGRSAPLRLRTGRYAFELFYRASGMREPRRERSFEHVLEQKSLEQYEADETVYLINYQISLPGVRRELAGLEWLPRGRQA